MKTTWLLFISLLLAITVLAGCEQVAPPSSAKDNMDETADEEEAAEAALESLWSPERTKLRVVAKYSSSKILC